jgi:glycosyltransferase involved in cell wall biosynthesis
MVASGYGEQTALFVPRIRDMGHDIAIAANFGIQGTTSFWDKIPVFSAQNYNSTVSTFWRHWKADWVITLYDSWVMQPEKWDEDLRMAIWAPVDEYPPPIGVLNVLNHQNVRAIAMSRFGEHWLRKSGLDPLYVPHGVDTSVFKPFPPEERLKARGVLEMPEDAFIVGMVGANRGWSQHAPRKSFPQAFDAFAEFARNHDDAYLYCHTQAQPASPGIDLILLARAVGIPEDKLAFPPDVAWHLHVMDNSFVAGIMNAFDVLLNPSMCEGFGIPIIEAQACGVPVITSDHSSMPELTQSGWLVSGDRWWDGGQMGFAIMPSVASIVERLEEAYEDRGNLKRREDAREFAMTYDVDRVAEVYWKPALEALGQPTEVGPLNGKGESRQVRRARQRRAAKT